MDDPAQLASAHEAWDERWQRPEVRGAWSQPDPLVESLVPLLRQRGLGRVLDVGCGIGRHALFLALEGFSVVGIDASPSALDSARARAAAAGVAVEYRAGSFYKLAFPDESFGAVVVWNVIYHGDGAVAARAVAEIHRVLRPRGLCAGTMLSTRNARYGQGREVRPNTFIVDAAPDDKVHPHFYCDAATLLDLHRGFELLTLADNEQTPGANHWHYLFERR